MSTITKERLTELSRRENVGAILGEEIAELARIALASLEAEAVAWIWRWSDDEEGFWRYSEERKETKGSVTAKPLYTAPPAAAYVPDKATPGNIEILASTYAPRGVTYQWDRDECNAAADSWNACRAAMLQIAVLVSSS